MTTTPDVDNYLPTSDRELLVRLDERVKHHLEKQEQLSQDVSHHEVRITTLEKTSLNRAQYVWVDRGQGDAKSEAEVGTGRRKDLPLYLLTGVSAAIGVVALILRMTGHA